MNIQPVHIAEVGRASLETSTLSLPENQSEGSFFDRLGEAISQLAAPLADGQRHVDAFGRGQEGELHETLLAVDKSDIALKYMVTLRNRGLEAYREIMRMGS